MSANDEYWRLLIRPEGFYYARRKAGEDAPLLEGECPDWESIPASPGARMSLCVPGVRVRTHLVSIPTGNRRRFLAALPFALEERLFRSPEAYHYVPLARSAGHAQTPVAVVEHEAMKGWVDAALAHGWQLEQLMPDYLLLPEPKPGTWFLDAVDTPLLLRFPNPGGGAALNEDIGPQPPGGLLLALEELPRQPLRLEVRVPAGARHEQVGKWNSWLAERGIELQRTQAVSCRAAWLVRRPDAPAGGNLLTGTYRPGKDSLLPARRAIPSLGLAAVLVIALAAQWFLEYSSIRAEHARLTRAIEDVYRAAFPDARNLVNPRHQMERRLVLPQETATAQQQQRVDVLDWLERLAPFLDNGADTHLESFVYDGRQLTLDLSLPDFQELENFQERMADALLVRVENAELRDGRVISRLRLELRT